MEEKRSAKRILRILCLILTIGGALVLLYQLGMAIWLHALIDGTLASTSGAAGDIGIIGGADGPTAITVTRRQGGNWALPIALLALVLGSAGLFRMRGKKE